MTSAVNNEEFLSLATYNGILLFFFFKFFSVFFLFFLYIILKLFYSFSSGLRKFHMIISNQFKNCYFYPRFQDQKGLFMHLCDKKYFAFIFFTKVRYMRQNIFDIYLTYISMPSKYIFVPKSCICRIYILFS